MAPTQNENDVNDSLWGRVDEQQFDYIVHVTNEQRHVTLTAVQDQSVCKGIPAFPSHGHCVWDAGLLLADYLQTIKMTWEGKKVVELGAGVGIVGMALAVLGAKVVLTDQQYALPLLEKNVEINFHGKNNAPLVAECQWGDPLQGILARDFAKQTNVVVFSDVIYHESAFQLLLQSVKALVHEDSYIFFSFETRNASIEAEFLTSIRVDFDVEIISRVHHTQIFQKYDHPEELFIYQARVKTPITR